MFDKASSIGSSGRKLGRDLQDLQQLAGEEGEQKEKLMKSADIDANHFSFREAENIDIGTPDASPALSVKPEGITVHIPNDVHDVSASSSMSGGDLEFGSSSAALR